MRGSSIPTLPRGRGEPRCRRSGFRCRLPAATWWAGRDAAESIRRRADLAITRTDDRRAPRTPKVATARRHRRAGRRGPTGGQLVAAHRSLPGDERTADPQQRQRVLHQDRQRCAGAGGDEVELPAVRASRPRTSARSAITMTVRGRTRHEAAHGIGLPADRVDERPRQSTGEPARARARERLRRSQGRRPTGAILSRKGSAARRRGGGGDATPAAQQRASG